MRIVEERSKILKSCTVGIRFEQMCGDRRDKYPGPEFGEEKTADDYANSHRINPMHDKSVEEVDTLTADELAKLSITDREKVYSDIHGVPNETQESSEFLRKNLSLLEAQLDNMLVSTPDESRAYNLALSKDQEYARDTRLRLRFLRADRFNIARAAERFLLHFAMKLDLFGDDLLVKDISQEDLDELDIDALHNETGFIMPFRDMGGRMLVVKQSTLTSSDNIPIRSILRAMFYAGMVKTEDQESQRKGIVAVAYYIGENLQWKQISSRLGRAKSVGRALSALPLRIEAIHFCSDSMLLRPLFAVFKMGVSAFTRMRVREHFGTHDTIRSTLQTFGIPCQNFPTSQDGKVAFKSITVEYWNQRRALESSREGRISTVGLAPQLDMSSSSARETTDSFAAKKAAFGVNPSRNDVLLGRGKAYYYHTGNRQLRDLVLERYSEYEEAKYSGKKKVCVEVLQEIHSKQGRFLKKIDPTGPWMEVDDEAAQRKISHIFRGLRGSGSNDEEETLSEEFKKRPSTELVGFKEEQRTSPRTMLNNEEKGQSAQRLSPEDSFKRRRSASKGK